MSITTDVTTVPGFSWSYSTLKNYETCPRRYYEYNVSKRVVEPESDAIKQGKSVHDAFDARVAKGTELPLGMGMYEGMLAKLASAEGKTYTERKLALASDFSPTTFFGKSAWFRCVLDYTNIKGDRATVLDYKTGRPGDDMTQLQLAAVTMFAHDAKVARVKTALLFVAYEQVERAEFVRADVTEIWGEVLPRVRKMVEARQKQDYPPKPGGLCRRWCHVLSCPFHGK
jgi:hypothetical protein